MIFFNTQYYSFIFMCDFLKFCIFLHDLFIFMSFLITKINNLVIFKKIIIHLTIHAIFFTNNSLITCDFFFTPDPCYTFYMIHLYWSDFFCICLIYFHIWFFFYVTHFSHILFYMIIFTWFFYNIFLHGIFTTSFLFTCEFYKLFIKVYFKRFH